MCDMCDDQGGGAPEAQTLPQAESRGRVVKGRAILTDAYYYSDGTSVAGEIKNIAARISEDDDIADCTADHPRTSVCMQFRA